MLIIKKLGYRGRAVNRSDDPLTDTRLEEVWRGHDLGLAMKEFEKLADSPEVVNHRFYLINDDTREIVALC